MLLARKESYWSLVLFSFLSFSFFLSSFFLFLTLYKWTGNVAQVELLSSILNTLGFILSTCTHTRVIIYYYCFGIKQLLVLGTVALACYPNTGEAGTRLPGIPGQPGLQSGLEGPV